MGRYWNTPLQVIDTQLQKLSKRYKLKNNSIPQSCPTNYIIFTHLTLIEQLA